MPEYKVSPTTKYSKRMNVQPSQKNQGKKHRIAFSFRFLRQKKNFGWAGIKDKWLCVFLEKLNELSKEIQEEFILDSSKKDTWRYHTVDWENKHVTVKRDELSWIHSEYRENEDDYPFYQFQLTKSHGRCIGFWDESNHFNIVLIDRMHNFHLSKYNEYKIKECQMTKF